MGPTAIALGCSPSLPGERGGSQSLPLGWSGGWGGGLTPPQLPTPSQPLVSWVVGSSFPHLTAIPGGWGCCHSYAPAPTQP